MIEFLKLTNLHDSNLTWLIVLHINIGGPPVIGTLVVSSTVVYGFKLFCYISFWGCSILENLKPKGSSNNLYGFTNPYKILEDT